MSKVDMVEILDDNIKELQEEIDKLTTEKEQIQKLRDLEGEKNNLQKGRYILERDINRFRGKALSNAEKRAIGIVVMMVLFMIMIATIVRYNLFALIVVLIVLVYAWTEVDKISKRIEKD